MPRRKSIPHRNRSPHGWWLASYLLRLQFAGEDLTKPKRRCLAWENTIILTAADRESAYKKAMRLGRAETNVGPITETETGRKGRWVFEGLTQLLPIFDELEDGAEILWSKYEGKSVETIRSWVRTKKELSVFDDRE